MVSLLLRLLRPPRARGTTQAWASYRTIISLSKTLTQKICPCRALNLGPPGLQLATLPLSHTFRTGHLLKQQQQLRGKRVLPPLCDTCQGKKSFLGQIFWIGRNGKHFYIATRRDLPCELIIQGQKFWHPCLLEIDYTWKIPKILNDTGRFTLQFCNEKVLSESGFRSIYAGLGSKNSEKSQKSPTECQ